MTGIVKSGVKLIAAAGAILVYPISLSGDLDAHTISECHLWIDIQSDEESIESQYLPFQQESRLALWPALISVPLHSMQTI